MSDFDGTIADNHRSMSEAMNDVLRHFGKEPLPESEWHRFYRPDYMEFYREVGVCGSEETLREILLQKQLARPVPPIFEGAEDTLRWLSDRHVVVAIVSMTSSFLVRRFMEFYGLDRYVREIHCGFNYLRKVEAAADLIRRHTSNPSEAVYIDDSDYFIREVKDKTGCVTIAFTRGYHSKFDLQRAHPDFMINSHGSVQRYIHFLNRKQAGGLK